MVKWGSEGVNWGIGREPGIPSLGQGQLGDSWAPAFCRADAWQAGRRASGGSLEQPPAQGSRACLSAASSSAC